MRNDTNALPDMEDQTRTTADPAEPASRWRTIAVVVAAVVVVGLAAAWLLRGGGAAPEAPVAAATPVRAAEVTRGDLAVYRDLPGELVGEAAALSPRISGRLESVLVRPGDRVKDGDVVAVVDAADLARNRDEQAEQVRVLEATLQRYEAAVQQAGSDLERGQAMFAEKLISAQDMDRLQAQSATARANLAAGKAQVEQARAGLARLDEQLSETRVRAPFGGTVAARYLDPGTVVQSGTAVVRLVQERPLLVQFRVPERLLGAVTPRAPFSITTQATGDTRFEGSVVRIAGEVSRTDRTALAEGELSDPPETLHPGMYADVRLQVQSFRDAVLVPSAAVVERLNAGEVIHGVFLAPGTQAATTASWRQVDIRAQQGGVAAVTGELDAGARVLTMGHEDLGDGAPIRVVEGPGSAPGPETRDGAAAGESGAVR